MELLLATRNPHKTLEFSKILGSEHRVNDLSSFEDAPIVEETGDTFEANAILKATAVSAVLDGIVIADDSGLEVDALGGGPGIFSARYSGEGATDLRNIRKLQDELANSCHEQRSARFRCVIAVARHGKVLATFAGAVEGKIIDEPRGTDGFGYDPIFVPNGFDKTFGELSDEIKNRISHRAKATQGLLKFLATDF